MNSAYSSSSWKLSAKHLTIIAMLVALCSVSRLAFTWLPNFTPVTTIFLLICLNFSFADALIVANITMVATGVYLGMGYWVFGQMISYTLVLTVFYLLTRLPFLRKLYSLLGLAFFSGLLYGFIISLVMTFIFNIAVFWAYYSTGLPFDLMHAFGSAVFMLVLYLPFQAFKPYYLKAVGKK
jgi:hypothetical protein